MAPDASPRIEQIHVPLGLQRVLASPSCPSDSPSCPLPSCSGTSLGLRVGAAQGGGVLYLGERWSTNVSEHVYGTLFARTPLEGGAIVEDRVEPAWSLYESPTFGFLDASTYFTAQKDEALSTATDWKFRVVVRAGGATVRVLADGLDWSPKNMGLLGGSRVYFLADDARGRTTSLWSVDATDPSAVATRVDLQGSVIVPTGLDDSAAVLPRGTTRPRPTYPRAARGRKLLLHWGVGPRRTGRKRDGEGFARRHGGHWRRPVF